MRRPTLRLPLLATVLLAACGDSGNATTDVATGTGLIANLLAEQGYSHVTGVDLSEGMMSHARRYAVVPLLEDEPVGVDRLEQLVMNGVAA